MRNVKNENILFSNLIEIKKAHRSVLFLLLMQLMTGSFTFIYSFNNWRFHQRFRRRNKT